MPDTPLRPFILQLDDAALGGHRLNRGDAQFHGFLQREVHAVAARQALHERHLNTGLPLHIPVSPGLDQNVAPLYAGDVRFEFAS